MKYKKRLSPAPCLVIACLLAFALGAARAQDSDPILSLDPGGHTALVAQVLFTPDGKELITAGEDKTVRIWRTGTGELVRTIRGQIGDGRAGKLYDAALSPDGQTLAVGGYLRAADGAFYIRLLDPGTGNVQRLISGLSAPSLALAFSADGGTLVSGEGAGIVRVCDVRSRKTTSLKGHAKDVYGVALSPDGRRIASASLDGTVRLWDVAAQKGRTLEGKVPQGYRCVAWSRDGRWIAAGGFDNTIHVWDGASGAARLTLTEEKYVNCLAFSPDGRMLAAGLGSDNPDLCDVRLWSVGPGGPAQTPVGDFTHHTATVQAVAFSPDSRTVASAGGLANDIYLWGAADSRIAQHLVSTGGATQDIAWSPDSTLVTWRNQTSGAPLQHTFNLADRSLVPNPSAEWAGPVLSQNGVTLSHGDDANSVRLSSGGRIRLNRPGDYVRCFTWTPAGDIVVGSAFGLSLYARNGDFERAFIGHTADILSVSVSPDHKYLASSSGDQTVRIWPLDPAGTPASTVAPFLSLFVGSDQQWVAWTHSGFYTCSSNGENVMGWQVNQGDARAAEFYPASRFHNRFFRDDIIGHLLAAGSEESAIALSDKGRTGKTDLSKTAANIADFAPPTVQIVEPLSGVTVADSTVTLKVHITDPNNRRLSRLTLTDNERAVPPPAGAPLTPQAGDMTLTAALKPGDNTLSVVVGNDAGALSVPATVRIVYGASAPPKIGTPTLYMISIGVSKYLDASNALRYPAKDAGDIAKLFQSQGGPGKMFSKVVLMSELLDRKATREAIISSLVALRKQSPQMSPNDYTVIFVAGHGANDDLDQYFFAPFDIDPDEIDGTGVDWLKFSQTLAQLPGKVILMLDTCHSDGVNGRIDKKDGYGRFLVESTLTRLNNESPVITFASCDKGQLSQESEAWDNGAFTKALLEGLGGSADTNRDGVVTINELNAYLGQRVSDLTKQAQRPVLTKPASVSGDLPLAVVGPLITHTAQSAPGAAVMATAPQTGHSGKKRPGASRDAPGERS